MLELAESDERVVAGAVVGSLALDDGDRFADLDLTFAVVDGLLMESTWSGQGPLHRRLAAGGIRSFGPSYVHDVVSIGDRPAVSVHVYSPQLTAMRTYRVDTGELLLTGIGPLDEW